MAFVGGNTRTSRGIANMDASNGPGYANTGVLLQNNPSGQSNDPPYAQPHQYHNGVSLEKFHNVGVSSRPHVREADSHSCHHRGKSHFDNIRSECLRRGRLYEDPEFLAHESSVYYSRSPSFRIEWKRPSVRETRHEKYFYEKNGKMCVVLVGILFGGGGFLEDVFNVLFAYVYMHHYIDHWMNIFVLFLNAFTTFY